MRYVMIDKKKPAYGPMVESMLVSGYELKFFGDEIPEGSSVVMFHKKPSDLPKIDGRVGMWMCDLRKLNEMDVSGGADIIFLCNQEHTKDYEKAFKSKVYYMPQTGIDNPQETGRRIDWDVVFIGNFNSKYHAERWEIINAIKEEFDVKVITGERNTDDQAGVYKNSPFCLAISPQAEGYTSNRLYNILGSGGFCLTLWFPGIEKLFENHKHLVWFKTAKEAIKEIEYYYDHPKEYEQIKKNGLKLYKEKHTAKHRLDNMFDILENKEDKFRGFLT